jgi:hypothetical protein
MAGRERKHCARQPRVSSLESLRPPKSAPTYQRKIKPSRATRLAVLGEDCYRDA